MSATWLCVLLLLAPQDDDLKKRVDKLERKVDQLQEENEELHDKIDKQEGVQPEQDRPSLLNPAITVITNILGRLDNKDVIEIEDGETINKDDKILLRETEIDFRASVDPYVDALVIIAIEQEVTNEFEVDVEEGYVTVKSLPLGFWEEPPLGIKVKLGRFLANVGRQNRLHTHDLPQSQRGLTLENFIGEHPYIAQGVSVEGFLPLNLTFTLEAMQGGSFRMTEEDSDHERPNYLGHLNWFDTFGEDLDVEIAGIAHYGANDGDGRDPTYLYSLDVMVKKDPVLFSGQAFYGSVEDDDAPNRAFGFFAYLQVQIDQEWYVGVRYDWTESLENRNIESWRVNPYISFYISEFFRFRIGYEYTASDDVDDDELSTLLIEINAIFGAHPPHPYWVNK